MHTSLIFSRRAITSQGSEGTDILPGQIGPVVEDERVLGVGGLGRPGPVEAAGHDRGDVYDRELVVENPVLGVEVPIACFLSIVCL